MFLLCKCLTLIFAADLANKVLNPTPPLNRRYIRNVHKLVDVAAVHRINKEVLIYLFMFSVEITWDGIGWIKGNVGQTGFYRVNYEQAQWSALTNQMDTDYTVSNLIVHVHGDDLYGIGNVIC